MFDDKKGKSVPGPGNYPQASQAFDNKHGYSMGAKLKDQSKMVVPGAGTYEPKVESQKPKAGAYSMGIKLKSDLVAKGNVPGPGQYVQDGEKMKTSAPKFGFGSSVRQDVGGN